MLEIFKVREGNTGILYFKNSKGEQQKYIPNYDLNIANELLLEFNKIKDSKGNSIKDNYWVDGINWYPTVINSLYSQIFFSYVKYRPIIHRLINNEIYIECQNKGNFYNLVSLMQSKKEGSLFKKIIFNLLIKINNKIIIKKYKAKLLFFKFTANDFRTSRVKDIFDKNNVNYIEVIGPTKKIVLSNIINQKAYYFYGTLSFTNRFDYKYDFGELDSIKKIIFNRAIKKIEQTITSFINEYNYHKKSLKNTSCKIFYGIDDTQIVYPLLYACNLNKIITIAHQHGAAYNKLHASYIMEGFNKEDYKWFDKVIVWGEYWKKQLLTNSNVYSPEMIVLGSNLFKYTYGKKGINKSFRRNVLIPYEFLTNTYKVGLYIKKLIDIGYKIYFKTRVDEKLRDQIEAYCLEEKYQKDIAIVIDITPELMEEIDIVAGTMTTLIYQLLPYNKVFWIFETEYRYLDDLIDENYAIKVRYEDLDNLNEVFFRKVNVDSSYFFTTEDLEETINKNVLKLQ